MNGEFCVAVHALVYLHHCDRVLSSEELAKNICTNPARVRKVMSCLKKAGLLASREGGGKGGYRFTGDPAEVTLLTVADALQTRCVEVRWHSGSMDMDCLVASGMGGLMDELADDLDVRCRKRLQEITLADLEQKLFQNK
jgi:DNA-binding IscR family transcriptional regulator